MSMFSQSLQIGCNTLIDLERIEKCKSAHYSENEIIEESPPRSITSSRRLNGNYQMSRRYRSIERKKKLYRSKSDSAIETSISSTSKSNEIFQSKTEVLQNDFQNLSNFFESDMECDISISIPTEGKIERNNKKHRNSHNISCNLTKITEQNICNIDQIPWDESFNSFTTLNEKKISIINDNSSIIIEDAMALGIDNVTFTHNFLQFDGNNENEIGNASKFIKNEIETCKIQVKSSLNEKELDNIVPENCISLNNSKNASSKIFMNKSDHCNGIVKENLKQSHVDSSIINERNITFSLQKENTEISTNLALQNISNWGLPESVINQYKKKGIDMMFEWQSECLSNKKVLILDLCIININFSIILLGII